MIISALVINSPNSPHISLKSYLPVHIPQLECSSSDDDDHNCGYIFNSNDSTTWHDQLAKSLISMYDNMHAIITAFEDISENTQNDVQQKKIKLEMMRMALILNPTDLPTYNNTEPTSPYIDLGNVDDSENSFLEQKTYHYEKFRWNIDRIISKLKRGMNKLRLVLFHSSYRNKSSTNYIYNFRKQIEKSLLKIRQQMIEYNRINKEEDQLKTHQNVIQQLFINNPLIEQRIKDYRIKLRPNKCNEKHGLISSPFIPVESDQKLFKNENHILQIETIEFPDLNRESNEFFEIIPSNTKSSDK